MLDDDLDPKRQLAAQTREEASETLSGCDFVALPCGTVEQHAAHLPLGVDAIRAEEMTIELVQLAPKHDLSIVKLPALAYGYSEHHMAHPGTISLRAETFQSLILDVGASLDSHGVSRLLLVNCHGGNREPLKLATDRLQRERDLVVHVIHWTDFARDQLEERWGDDWGHAGEHETSVVERYYPDLVHEREKRHLGERTMPSTRPYAYFDEVTDTGGTGDPRRSDPAFIEEVIETTTDKILRTLTDEM